MCPKMLSEQKTTTRRHIRDKNRRENWGVMIQTGLVSHASRDRLLINPLCLWHTMCSYRSKPLSGTQTKDTPLFSACLCVLTHFPSPSPSAEKRQDALPDRRHHKLPGSLHLHGGAACRLLPLPVSKVGLFFLLWPPRPPQIIPQTSSIWQEASALWRSLVPERLSFLLGKTIWSWDEAFPISIRQM